jgi:sporulation protein YlmC with PRC-barrel domain
MAKEKTIKISELIPDDKNFNQGSEFGNSLIEKSFTKFGAGRSILIDKNNKIIAGNKSAEHFGAIGMEDVEIIESDGKRLIAVKRTDIDLDTPEGRELALADNATAKANIVWAEDVIASELGVEVGESWGVEITTADEYREDFNLKDGDKEPFQQITFTLADMQAKRIKEAINVVTVMDGTQYGNENSNGNGLHQIILEWEEQRRLS